MSTQFFERQDTQRKYTKVLVGGFIAAILLVIVVINLIVIVGAGVHPQQLVDEPGIVLGISGVVGATILLAALYKSSQLSAGGSAVARALGGVPVTADDGDLARKRLLNIVEEMAIAARIRKPQVFLLPDEMAINAFAAGHSPDEAAVAVTQGALDAFDRDQMQAVIGHEFSHILNGDMKINMRLTAWIFGLWVITDIALRLMRGRSRGKDAAKLKLIAFGVFIAGSVGMVAGRMLQAAVSRRREHLADASAVQFTRNPGALQGAFIAMAANHAGTKLEHEGAAGVAHMFIASSEPAWAHKFGGAWFSTHPSLEERVRALDSRVTPSRFRSLVSEERRRLVSKQLTEEATAAGEPPPAIAGMGPAMMSAVAIPAIAEMPVMAMTAAAAAPVSAPGAAANRTSASPALASASSARLPRAPDGIALEETFPTGVRLIGGRPLPPDVLRNRLSNEQQSAIVSLIAQLEKSTDAVQGAYVATMLAAEPAKWRTQLTRLAPVLGIELFKETQAQIARIAQLAPASRLPLLIDMLSLLDGMDPAHRKRLRAVARAFAPTVAAGDMLRFAVTRVLEKRLGKTAEAELPVPLPERAAAVCELYAALARCRFPNGNQGLNAYRAGLMGLLPPQKWAPYAEALIAPAQLDAAIAGIAQIHPTGRRSFSEGMARVLAVGGRLTIPQVDLLRATCLLVDCQVPLVPVDVVFEETESAPAIQASAR